MEKQEGRKMRVRRGHVRVVMVCKARTEGAERHVGDLTPLKDLITEEEKEVGREGEDEEGIC